MLRDDTSSASAPTTGDGAALLPPGPASQGWSRPQAAAAPPSRREPLPARAWGLQRAPATLAKLAVTGGGPGFHKAGRWPLYDPDDLDEWASRLIGKALVSTSQHEAA
jgi:hypothetical protein